MYINITEFIKEAEGFYYTKYKDSIGVTTIGHGLTDHIQLLPYEKQVLGVQKITQLDEISEENSTWILERVITDLINELQGYEVYNNVPEYIQTVLIDCSYNQGVTNTMKKFKKMQKHLAEGDYINASIELLDSNYAETVKGRALRNAILMSTGQRLPIEECRKMWKVLKERV